LTFACGFYDRTEALRTGDVKVKDIELDFIAIDSPRDLFDRMGGKQEFDASEFSSSEYISRLGRGDYTFVALPVFPLRNTPDGNTCSATKVESPRKRVGVPLYTMTAAVWIRGILSHHYDVDLSALRWTEGAINHPGRHGEPSAPPLLKPVEIAHDPKGRSLSDLLANHEIDVIMGTQHPDPHPDITPLFANARAVERAFYEQTRIFPIMHLVVMRRDVYERDRSIADKLYRGFVEAKALALKRMHKGHPFMLPWVHNDIHEIDAVFGGDPYAYGIEANRPTLEGLVQYMAEQHFIPKAMPLEEPFAPVDKALR